MSQHVPVACEAILSPKPLNATPAPDQQPTPTAEAIQFALSAARLSTYITATKSTPALDAAVALYEWNSLVSAALLHPLSVCEVVIRNAAADALEKQYGADWPWHTGLVQSLPDSSLPAFNPKRELTNTRQRFNLGETGKVIAELKFKFWEALFTARFDRTLWNAHLRSVLPNLNADRPVYVLRKQINADLENIRKLRNRIAHHEPIFTRNLTADLVKISRLIGYRSAETENWMKAKEQASALIGKKPA